MSAITLRAARPEPLLRRAHAAALLLLLALVAAIWAPPARAVAGPPIEAPFEVDADGRLIVDVAVPGGVLKALIDTGSTPNLFIQPAAAERVKIRYLPFMRSARISGVDGKGERGRFALVKIVKLGPVTGDWDVAGVVTHTPILKADAILGMGFVGNYDANFDFKGRTLTLTEPVRLQNAVGAGFANCIADRPSVSLAGRCGDAMVFIDTGARRSVMNRAMAARLGLPAGAEGTVGSGRGGSGRSFAVTRYDHPVEVAGLRLPYIEVADLPDVRGCKAPCARMQLGMDVLGGLSGMSVTRSRIVFRP